MHQDSNETPLVDLQSRILQLTEDKASATEHLAGIQKELDDCKLKMIAHLKAAGLTNFKSPLGTVAVSSRFSVRLPASNDHWNEFYDYLKEIGQYEDLRTVNSQRLNSWYKEQMEQAKQRGDIDWHAPGLEAPSAMETLSVRKG